MDHGNRRVCNEDDILVDLKIPMISFGFLDADAYPSSAENGLGDQIAMIQRFCAAPKKRIEINVK